MHPNGLHLLVGFSDRLRFMNILGDDIREFKSFSVRACAECAFSSGGQYFAAVHSNVVDVYNSNTCERITQLRGHNGKVKALHWSHDDSRLISVGVDGAVFEWNIHQGSKNDHTIKSVNYTSVVCDSRLVLAAGNDRKLREFDIANHLRFTADYDLGDVNITAMAFATSQRLLFCGGEDGSIRVMTFPLNAPPAEITLGHSAPISRMHLSFDEGILFSVSEDGSLFLFDVKNTRAPGAGPKDRGGGAGRPGLEGYVFADEVLIAKGELDEKNATIGELREKLEEQRQDTDVQLKRWAAKHDQRIAELTDNFREENERLSQQLDSLVSLKNEQELSFAELRRDMLEKHRAEMARASDEYDRQLTHLNNQIKQLKQEHAHTIAEHDQTDAQLKEAHQRAKQEIEDVFQEALDNEKDLNLQLRSQLNDVTAEGEEVRAQIEVDVDIEVEDLRAKYETKLLQEKEAYLHLKGENGIMRKKFNTLQKENLERLEELKQMVETQRVMEKKIHGLEKDIEALKNEIKERDETIGDKERRIFDLKKKNQELEKFKFVLDYKIRELKAQIEPKHDEITNFKAKIRDMDGELARYSASNSALQLTISDLKSKGDASSQEIKRLQHRVRDAEIFRQRVRTDLSELATLIQDPKGLKEGVRKLYSKHCQQVAPDGDPNSTGKPTKAGIDDDLHKEYHRQRDYLERTVESLKKKLAKDHDSHKSDVSRIMAENVVLIQEVNELRREIRAIRAAAQAAESPQGTVGVGGADATGNYIAPAAGFAATAPSGARGRGRSGAGGGSALAPQNANATAAELAMAQQKLHTANREIDMQRAEIQRLRARLSEMERELHAIVRPQSSERLPPMDGF
eukprot:NODE_124_length_2690_cov_42.754638_g100_i0.p1 GENE.NODE_124_length_2690_cov_42.754638_g100_i0~~NODE_124_length_2690_cov_42.754638_g100_i0.p1  ORF type:complete len:876 (+),score=301.78 NODE_124_length_2690_cov_42.754638_g100_i0:62-2629(+)